MLSCHYVRARAEAYHRRELETAQRRAIAKHLEACAECRAYYARTRELHGELTRTLPAVSPKPQKEAIWRTIQGQLAHPTPKPALSRWQRAVVVCLTSAGLIALGLGAHPLQVSLPTPPKPVQALAFATPTARASALSVSVALTQAVGTNDASLLHNTPDNGDY
jgi:anti-sigma factor RsiW